ncbi:hypothetical protein ACFL3H_10875, partial [Gemmatimonadota bacterium]
MRRIWDSVTLRVLPLLLTPIALSLVTASGCAIGSGDQEMRFEISFPVSVSSEPVNGRAFLILSDDDSSEPRLQVSRRGTPFFGVDVDALRPGEAAVIDALTLGAPVESLQDLVAGEYFVQALINVYTKFERSDGHTVWM